eukprot:TRINITY_DN80502_c0_g1_i1.p1 TRINITY_DN80502_c0_g1~~TRINITY_DN80502_c0_g1_i1.p1  ORF type:complete len:408 (-),score=84.17 TRINITY_DN80502_c0_g1_i1:40-1122(-)
MGWKTDPSCWTDTLYLENCCHLPEANGTERGCWDAQFTFAKCCGGREWKPEGYDAWIGSPLSSSASFAHCSELVRRFDFSEEYVEGGPLPPLWTRFRACIKDRLELANSAFRQPVMAGQHYPTLLTPGPKGLMFAIPAQDFVVSKAIKMYGTFDPEELRLYQRLLPVGATVVDVGANVGAYAVPLAMHVGREGLVVAAEPFHTVFQMLTANSAINGLRNLRTRQVGLGTTEERVRARGPSYEDFSNAGMSRIYRPFEDSHAETFHYRANKDDELVHVITLDKLAEEEELRALSLLKVDVEGHLKAVLAGGQETIRRFRPIVVAEDANDDALPLLEQTHGYQCKEELEEHALWVCVPLEKR